uniref:Uncharacterized protein n=1 Tax=Medicago truncatula TaxID=3880 RepID=A2Q3G6_MEDTR|nr:hypothetical protein MtrDRAFT_AC155882g12v2 [Medicago truncatula]
MFRERQNQILLNFPEMSNRLRFKRNQTLMELQNMLTPVSSHFKPTKLTRLGFFQTTLSRKIEKNCLSGHVVKQIRRDLQLLHKDQA